jgi:hypothetical protein
MFAFLSINTLSFHINSSRRFLNDEPPKISWPILSTIKSLSKDAMLSFYCNKTYFDVIIVRMIPFDASIF